MGFGLGGSAKIKVEAPKVEMPKVDVQSAVSAGVDVAAGAVAHVAAKAKETASVGGSVGSGEPVVDAFTGDAEDIPMQPHTVMESGQATDKVEIIFLGEW